MRRLPVLLLLAPALAFALTGQVLDEGTGQPLAGVNITVRWFNGERQLPGGTDAEGRFDLPLLQFFTAGTPAPRSLNVRFAADGYVPETLFLEQEAGGTFAEGERLVRLAPLPGETPAAGENDTVYVLPYRVSSSSAETDPEALQGLIAEYLTSGLDIYLQEIPEPVPLEAFGLQKLGENLEIGDTRQVLAFGRTLKDALAIVGGQARVAASPEAGERVEFSSRYVMVPTVEGVGGRVLRWDDALPTGLVSARPIAEQLNRLWGRNTVLAIGVAGYNKARTLAPPARGALLGRVEAFLRAELRDAADDEPLVAELKSLVARVAEARGP